MVFEVVSMASRIVEVKPYTGAIRGGNRFRPISVPDVLAKIHLIKQKGYLYLPQCMVGKRVMLLPVDDFEVESVIVKLKQR